MHCRFGLAVALALFATVGSLRGEDWPMYRHDRLRSGVTGEKLALPLKPIWTFASRASQVEPRPTDSPMRAAYPECIQYNVPMIAAGDAVYFTSANDGRIVCLDAATGHVRWEFAAGAGVNRSPTFWQQRIYAGSDDGYVYCLDAVTGKLVWKYRAAPTPRCFLAYGKMTSAWPVRTDVLVDGGVAYFAAGVFPHEGTFLYALDARTGKLLWRNDTQCENGHQLSLAPGGHLYVTGKDIWVPKDYRGYSMPYYGSPTPFRRSDGAFVNGFGSSLEEDPERPKIAGAGNNIFWPLVGVEKDGVRFAGSLAWLVEEEEKTRRAIWRHETPDRWVDFDSALGVRGKRDVVDRYDPDACTVMLAGGAVFHSAFDVDPAKGVGSGIYARDPRDGRVLWTTDVAERANQLLAANGRLFVGTRSRTIYCFAPQGDEGDRPATEQVAEQVATQPFGNPGETKDPSATLLTSAADTIVEQAGVTEGYALVLDCRSGQLAYELAKRTKMYVCAVFVDEHAAVAARAAYAKANLHVSRISAWHVPRGEALPFPSFFADLVVSESAALGGDLPGDVDELTRMLKPIRGVALIGGKSQDEAAVKKWAASTKKDDWQLVTAGGHWAKRVRPPLADAGGWTHMHADAGNSACSHDGALRAPLGVAWYGPPYIEQPGTHTALVLDGILVVPQPNALEACDQYTGRRLWRLDAGGIGTSIAAGGNRVYAKVAHTLAQIDLVTGKEVASYLTAFGKEHPWGWFAVAADGKTVFGAAGGGLFATEMESGQGNVRWALGGPDAAEPDRINGLMALDGGRIYVLGGAASEEQRQDSIAQLRAWMKTQSAELRDEYEKQIAERDIRELIAIDAESGKILYRRGVDVSNCGGAWLRPGGKSYGSKRHYNPSVGMGMYVRHGVVVIASESSADKGWGMWNSGAYDDRAITAYDGETGKLLWYEFTNHRTRPVIVDDVVYAEPWAFDLRTGAKKTRLHPITGEPADWAWCRPDKQCGVFSASKYFLFGRNKGFGYQDLANDDGLYTFWHSRSNCYVDHVSGGGLMIKPPQAIYCECQWSMPFTVAMGHVPTRPAAAPQFAQPGESLPVKHLRIDFGANGDRRDGDGNLWLASTRPANHPLLLGYDLQMALDEGGEEVRRSAAFTAIDNSDEAFVFASAVVGLRRCVLPLARDEDGAGTYRVRLGFAALPDDESEQRVFDVRLNGREVLSRFDVAVEAGGPDRAIWKEFQVSAERQLVLDMTAQAGTDGQRRLPILQALDIERERIDTVGMAVNGEDLWFNKASPRREVTVKLANLRDTEFRGRLRIAAQSDGLAKFDDAGEIVLPPQARIERTLNLEISDGASVGTHALRFELVDDQGELAVERTLAVEWLGDLQRRVLTGGVRCIRQEPLRQMWAVRTKLYRRLDELLEIATGFHAEQDGGAATSYLWFHVPAELRGKPIQRARVRVAINEPSNLVAAALRESPPRDVATAESRGRVQRLQGPPWPDFNKVAYPDLPPTAEASSPLIPVSANSTWVEADVPGGVEASDERPDVYVAVEATGPGSVVFGGAPSGATQAPAMLLLDY